MKLTFLYLSESKDFVLPETKHIEWITKNNDEIDLTSFNKIMTEKKPVLILSTGPIDTWKNLFGVSFDISKRWCHYTDGIPQQEEYLLDLFLRNNICHPKEETMPLLSIITTTFNSGEKFLRPYYSLKSQSYNNYEWIIWDDSPDDKTYNELLKYAENDSRIRIYKAPKHSGFIGQMKELAGGLARGKWVIELDHDDIIDSRLLEYIADIDIKYPEAEFIYSDFVELYEDSEHPFMYSDFYGMGFGSYVKQYTREKYHYVAQACPINPYTLSHIVGVPNHIRVWKTSTYNTIKKHHYMVPVADDYELILRTFLHSDFTIPNKWIRIVGPMYYQFRNRGGNNFTFLRNGLIQSLVSRIYKLYYPRLIEKYKQLGWDIPSSYLDKPIWEIEKSDHIKSIEYCYVPEDRHHLCVSIILPVTDDMSTDVIKKSISNISSQRYQHWILFVIGSQSETLDDIMKDYTHKNIRYYNLTRPIQKDDDLVKYAKVMLVRTRSSLVYKSTEDWEKDDFLEKQVLQAINESE